MDEVGVLDDLEGVLVVDDDDDDDDESSVELFFGVAEKSSVVATGWEEDKP